MGIIGGSRHRKFEKGSEKNIVDKELEIKTKTISWESANQVVKNRTAKIIDNK